MQPIKKPTVEQFTAAIQRGIEAFEEAGQVLVALIEINPKVKDEILENCPDVTEEMLDTFERIGRRQLFYRLAIHEGPGVKALRRCSYSDQVKYFNEPIPLLITDGKNTETLNVGVHALTPEQARQAVGAHRIRSLGEQRAWIESQKSKAAPIPVTSPYSVHRGKITFHQPCTMSVSELARLLAEASSH